MRVAKWTGILGFVVILLVSPLAVAAQVPVTAPRAASVSLAFVPVTSPDTFTYPRSGVRVGDLNRDGRADLLVSDDGGDGRVLLGDGTGNFRLAPLPPFFVGRSARLGDANGDGLPDLLRGRIIESNGQRDFVPDVQLGNGDGTFRPAPGASASPAITPGVIAADFNGDGVLDLVLTSGQCVRGAVPQGPCALYPFRGRGDGTFVPLPLINMGSFYPRVQAVGDITGDGIPDIVLRLPEGRTPPRVSLLFRYTGVGDGTFRNDGEVSQAASLAPLRLCRPDGTADSMGDDYPLLVDVDCDGAADYLVYTDDGIGVQRGDGAGGFLPSVLIVSRPTTGARPTVVAVADVTGDGRPDVLTFTTDGQQMTLVQQPPRPQPVARTAAAAPPAAMAVPQVAPAPRVVPPVPAPVPTQTRATAAPPVAAPLPNPAPPRR